MYAVRLKEIADVLRLLAEAGPRPDSDGAVRDLVAKAAAIAGEARRAGSDDGYEEQLERIAAVLEETVLRGVAAADSPEVAAFGDAPAENGRRGTGDPPAIPPADASRERGPLDGETLARKRCARGMKQKDLAEALGVSQGYLSRIENVNCPFPGGELGERLSEFIASGTARPPGGKRPGSSNPPGPPIRALTARENAAPLEPQGAGSGDPPERTPLAELVDVCSRLAEEQLIEVLRKARALHRRQDGAEDGP